ncbi:MAG: LytR C-terminal domain-containing protein [Thermoleophilia bacterium]|nr:LytR C-terminal domain-containing protein [Thermoleophilia bacterium]
MGLPNLRVVADTTAEPSPLASARVRRRMTIEQAAAKARLSLDDVRALEESRIYRFPSVNDALAAVLVYAHALGISEREARQLAGLPGGRSSSFRRVVAGVAFALAGAALASFVLVPKLAPTARDADVAAARAHPLPPPWDVRVDVYNGTRRANAATRIANEIGGPLAYRIGTVENAERLDYVQTRVYYPRGSEEIARRLADELDVETAVLPGKAGDASRLIVIVGEDLAR